MRKCQKRPAIWQKRPSIRTKETYRYTGIPEVCVCASVKRGLPYGKRDLVYAQKRPTDILSYLRYAYAQVSKETNMYMAKEPYGH